MKGYDIGDIGERNLWNEQRQHNALTKGQADRISHSSKSPVISASSQEAVIFVWALLMDDMYKVWCWDGLIAFLV
jgi:hypothetical protein